jgi:hypothetical protein
VHTGFAPLGVSFVEVLFFLPHSFTPFADFLPGGIGGEKRASGLTSE